REPAGECVPPFVHLRAERLPHGPLEPRVAESVGAERLRRQEAPRQLVLPSGASFEGPQAPRDAVLDGMVEAYVEVQEGVLLEGAPVAPEEAILRGDVEGAGDEPSLFARLDDLDVLGKAGEDPLVEGLVEPSPPPHELVDGRAVQSVGLARKPGGTCPQLLSANGADLDPLLGRRAHLALDGVPILGAEAG